MEVIGIWLAEYNSNHLVLVNVVGTAVADRVRLMEKP